MLDAIRAEALKFTRHRATWGLVWIWPIGLIVIGVIAIIVGLVNGPGAAAGRGEATAAAWISDATAFWRVPGQGLGRYVIGAFVAVVFAGEYGWNTWKLIVPHRARSSLIAAKYVIALALLACGFVLASILFNAVGWIEDVVTGDPIPPGIAFGALIKAHGLGALASLAPLLLTTAYVSLAAILTRSTVAALMIGFFVTTAEQLFRTFAPLLALYAPTPVGALYQLLPGYHVVNVGGWITTGEVLVMPFPSGPYSAPFAASLAIVAAWIGLLVGLTFWRFRRQDLN
jgi:ABC-type transport system involved in multi-copper enzyme maturation permease subunit